MLGPHVVGQRVVIRRVVAGEVGPTGGPALTDVLGTCTAWGDGVCVVQPDGPRPGGPVTIRIADIVSGKPVPPRPSVRQRVSAREAESHAAPLWPGVDREALGEWELRTEPVVVDRPRKRANSCLAMGDPGVPLEQAADRVVAFYTARRRPAMVQVEADADVERWFTDAGWSVVPGGDARFLLGSVSRARRLLADGRATGSEEVDLEVDGLRALARVADRAVGRAARDGDWLGVHDVHVAPASRRHGLARRVVGALVEWGAEQGATTWWLHVEAGNTGALAFYEQLGLAEHHACRYLAAP